MVLVENQPLQGLGALYMNNTPLTLAAALDIGNESNGAPVNQCRFSPFVRNENRYDCMQQYLTSAREPVNIKCFYAVRAVIVYETKTRNKYRYCHLMNF
jgi:hypothetical protein